MNYINTFFMHLFNFFYDVYVIAMPASFMYSSYGIQTNSRLIYDFQLEVNNYI